MNMLDRAQSWIVWLMILLVPVAASNYFFDPLIPTKFSLLGIGIGLIVLLKALEIVKTRKLEISLGNFDLPVLLLVGAYVLVGVVRTPNKMEAFFYPGASLLYIVCAVFYFAVNQVKNKKATWMVLLGSGVILSLLTIIKFLGVFEKNFPAFINSPVFNFSGDYLTAVIFLATITPIAIYFLISFKEVSYKLLVGSTLLVVIIGLLLSISSILPGKATSPIIPSVSTSWVVATESLKENPLFGVGPGNYLSAFNRFRPISYNQTNMWLYRSANATNFYLTSLTETGIIGIAAVAILVVSIVRYFYPQLAKVKEKKIAESIIILPLLLIITFFAVFPATLISTFLLFVLLSLSGKERKVTFELSKNAAIGGGIILAGIITYLVILYKPAIAAELSFQQAFVALNANDARKTYELLQSAVSQKGDVDRYHATYAQVNIAIARSLSTSQKELSDDNKKILEQLIQQAVREGQSTVALNKERSDNWQILAKIYQTLIPVAKDVDQFALQAYTQAINLDPTNPNLRIVLGGLFYGKKDWDNAIDSFKLAVAAKPDLANAHYNLSAAYREKGDYTKAIAEMETVLKLTPADSSDYQKAKTELEDLKKKKPSETQNISSDNLTAPQKFDEKAKPQLQLPQDANPPAGPTLPTPTPAPSPTPGQ